MKDRREEAVAVMAKYHGDGDENSPLVTLQLHEIQADMSVTRNDNPWWDFRELGNTPAARYRLYMVIAMAFFGQWSGNNGRLHIQESQLSRCFMHTKDCLLILPKLSATLCHKWSQMQESRIPLRNYLSTRSTQYSRCWEPCTERLFWTSLEGESC